MRNNVDVTFPSDIIMLELRSGYFGNDGTKHCRGQVEDDVVEPLGQHSIFQHL